MNAPIGAKIGMALGFSALALFAINEVGTRLFDAEPSATHAPAHESPAHESDMHASVEPSAHEAAPVKAEASHDEELAPAEDPVVETHEEPAGEVVTEEAVDGTEPAEATEPGEAVVEDVVVEEVVEEAPVSRFATANLASGAKVFKKCAACHTVDNGGANKIGPNLWDVVGRAKAGSEGFKYSGALSATDGTWDVADLDAFLTKPKDFVPGTRMTFAGLKREKDRTNIIAYLATLSDAPQALE